MNLQNFYEKLDEIFQQRDAQKVVEFLEQSLGEAKEQDDALGIIAVSNELGGVYRVLGKTEQAKQVCEDVLKRIKAVGMGDTQHYATALLNAGDVRLSAGEWEAALDLFIQAKERLTALELGEDYRMAALCNNMSVAYRETGKLQEAENVLETALSVISGLPGCAIELATTYVNLGELQVKQEKLDAAKESLGQAVRLFEESQKTKDPHYASALTGLGEVLSAEGELESAKSHYTKALGLIEQSYGKDSPAYQVISRNLAKIEEAEKEG